MTDFCHVQVSGATGFVQNYPGLVVLRFLVGVTEAPYFPGCIFFLSSWYTKDELPSRIAIFYSGYTIASAFGGLIAAGVVGNMHGAGGYPSWVSKNTGRPGPSFFGNYSDMSR